MPTLPTIPSIDFGFQDFGQPINSPPPKETPSYPPYGQQQTPQQPPPQPPQQPSYPNYNQQQQPTYNQPTFPQPNYNQPPPQQPPQTKKRMDPDRINTQNQAMTQLQNAISELSFNRCTQAK